MDDFQKLLLETFAEEVRETVQALEKALLGLEQALDEATREQEFAVLARRAHNLKGAAGAAGITAVQSLCHALEDGLTTLRGTGTAPTPAAFDVLYAAVDGITTLAEADEPARRIDLEEQLRKIELLMTPDSTPADPTLAPPVGAVGPTELATLPDVPSDPTEELPAPPRLEEPPRPAPPRLAPSSRPAPIAAPLLEAEGEAEEEELPDAPLPVPKPPGAAATSQAADASEQAQQQTVRIAVSKLDALTNQISEIITLRKKSQARLAEVEELGEQIALCMREFASLRGLVDQVVDSAFVEQAAQVSQALGTMQTSLAALDGSFATFQRQTWHEATTESLLTEQLPEDIKRLRMRPFSTIADHLRRTVRDAARHCDKAVRFELDGMDAEADQVVLEVLRDPLMHLLRNAVDHGIEHEAERLAAGKDPTGEIRLAVESRGATLLIHVRDDGHGINLDALRKRLRDRNLMPETHIEAMSDRELIDLIFLPGFTTASSLGVISGRGIGMDVVRQAIQVHHGSVSVSTVPGKGTTFELTMPLSFATIQGIIVRVLGHDFAMPMYALERLVRLSRRDINYLEGTPTADIEGEPVALVQLSALLEVPPNFAHGLPQPEEGEQSAVTEAMLHGAVIRANDRRIAFLVDDFVGESEMVVKEMPDCLGRIRNVAGATVTWSGEVMIILNPNELVEGALAQRTGPAERPWAVESLHTRRILVVDDSVTTRTLEKNILVAAGYDVVTANNGIEALRLAGLDAFDLVVLDIDMPELSGFDVAARLRSMNEYRTVPIILVTSRDSEEDKRRGMSAGADAYITKQSFTQRTFLESVRRFLA